MIGTNLNLIPYDYAIKLKKLNFDYLVDFFYDKSCDIVHDGYKNHNDGENVSAPSCSIARQWLRDVYGLDIFIVRMSNVTMPNLGYGFLIYLPENYTPYVSPEPYECFEVAELKALVYVLENYAKDDDE